jgi:3-oxoacyl-[acyl-carrier-protein] synthase-3
MESKAMYILGAGAAYPDLEISDEFLRSLGLALSSGENSALARLGFRGRRTSLPLEYIESSRNTDVLEGRAKALESPTSLGVKAARQALERAGITIDEVGLLIADCGTPYQTCPSEAQRIAGAFNVKVAAYDVVAGSGAMPVFIEMLSTWKPERLPDYVLCVSTNTPSQQVSFSEPTLAPYVFGDAASAFVLSPRREGKLRVVDSYLRKQSTYKAVVSVDRHIGFCAEQLLPSNEVANLIEQGCKRLSEKSGLSIAEALFIGPQLFCGDLAGVAAQMGISHEAVVVDAISAGYSLGSGAGCAVASCWDQLKGGQQVVLIHAGDGLWSGSVMFASE